MVEFISKVLLSLPSLHNKYLILLFLFFSFSAILFLLIKGYLERKIFLPVKLGFGVLLQISLLNWRIFILLLKIFFFLTLNCFKLLITF